MTNMVCYETEEKESQQEELEMSKLNNVSNMVIVCHGMAWRGVAWRIYLSFVSTR